MARGTTTDPGVGYDINTGLGNSGAPLATGTANHCAALVLPTLTAQVLLLIATAAVVWGSKQPGLAHPNLLSRGVTDDNGLDHWHVTRSNACVSNGSGGYTIVDGFILQKDANRWGSGGKTVKQYFIEMTSVNSVINVGVKGISL
jgi:hypothetical protein